ncbi:hypothetical protein B0O99DRAFT_648800 [Bisporella sp. PMI_857]|nr:hypothetical protein B0O99DRAFT_648800 [Bisporella sp. PMI_857]
MTTNEYTSSYRRKRMIIVGAANHLDSMSVAYHLSQHRDKFDVTLIDAVDYCGGQAFSIPIEKGKYGASWFNQGVQGWLIYIPSHLDHVRSTRLPRRSSRASSVIWQGQDFLDQCLFALLPLRLVFKLFLFSQEFTDAIALPMMALFLGTGNETPETPTIMFERLCTSPTYGMWYNLKPDTVISNHPPMVVFPNFSKFYATWKGDLISRGVKVRLSTELTEVVQRNKRGIVVRLKSRTPAPDGHNPNGSDANAPIKEDNYDELVMCTPADTTKQLLGNTASWKENKVLGAIKFSDDITITHNDSDYMKNHYENFYRGDLAVGKINGVDQQSRLNFATNGFRPMYYIKMYEMDMRKLEMSFDTTNYQGQFPEKVPFGQHVFQTIYLNKAKGHARFASSWTLVNAHEAAMISGLAAAVGLGADYPKDLENDRFAFLSFRLYYLLSYGKWYRRRFTKNQRVPSTLAAKERASWAIGLYGSVYQGPGVAKEERQTWREEMQKGTSTDNLTEGNAPGRSQPWFRIG